MVELLGTSFDSTSWPDDAPFLSWPHVKACAHPDVPDAYLIEVSATPEFTKSAAVRLVNRPARTAAMREHLVRVVAERSCAAQIDTPANCRLKLDLPSVREKIVDMLVCDPGTSAGQLLRLVDNLYDRVLSIDRVNRVEETVIMHPNADSTTIAGVLCLPVVRGRRGVRYDIGLFNATARVRSLVALAWVSTPFPVRGFAYERDRRAFEQLWITTLVARTRELEELIQPELRATAVTMWSTWSSGFDKLLATVIDVAASSGAARTSASE